MKRDKIKYFVIALMCCFAVSVGGNKTYAQRVVKIGQAEISVQSPILVTKRDTLSLNEANTIDKKRIYPRKYSNFFFGLGTIIPFDRENSMDMQYGRVNSIELGYKYFYKLSKRYALGTTFQYTFYNYKLKDAAQNNLFFQDVPGNVKKEYFRTDNIGTGLINRFYLFPLQRKPFMLDLGGYLDFSYSKRYNVKSIESGKTRKHKYRDASKFNPIQAGLYGAITKGGYSLYVRYRLTNLFNPLELEPELPELSIGVQFNW